MTGSTGKMIMCDMSNFTLGVTIGVYNNGKMNSKVIARSKEEAIGTIYALCEQQKIGHVFIRPLAPTNTDKMINEFKQYGVTNYSKIVDKVYFHMI